MVFESRSEAPDGGALGGGSTAVTWGPIGMTAGRVGIEAEFVIADPDDVRA